jgi:CRISPR-associated endonuclease Csn1
MNYVLGLDLGVSSLGWAVLNKNKVVDAGVRIFRPGHNAKTQTDWETGSYETKNNVRREARHRRRQLKRTKQRLNEVFRFLQAEGLLPVGPEDREAYFTQLDRRLLQQNPEGVRGITYYLRKKALDEKLTPEELGRVFYNLTERRGFKSNRKGGEMKDGDVKAELAEIDKAMTDTGARTLGEYLWGVEGRIRDRYTAREWYVHEYNTICEKQGVDPVLAKKLFHLIFFQRPLQSQRDKVGKCPYTGKRRIAKSTLLFERFRMLQGVNHLGLEEDERLELIKKLEACDMRQPKKLREKYGDLVFGCPIRLAFSRAFGERWTTMDQDRVVADVLSIENDNGLKRRLSEVYDLDEEQQKILMRLNIEADYAGLSAEAIRRLLPLMEQGVPYMTAVTEVFPPKEQECFDLLPPVHGRVDTNNPIVLRMLTEVRKQVNAVVRQYGKPERIRIELARDLYKAKKVRQGLQKKMNARAKERKHAEEELRKVGIAQPSRKDVDKFLLAEEFKWKCPYTGTVIDGVKDLFSGRFDVDHIIPYSRCLDDSFHNKAICLRDENRAKSNRTPYEMYGEKKWDVPAYKLCRFKQKACETSTSFVSRQLNDTRYASVLASRYLMCLCPVDVISSGTITAKIRAGWKIKKNRDDHRHHAMDAIIVACCNRKLIEQVCMRRDLGQPPHNALEIYEKIEAVHRPITRVRGSLHKETHYAEDGRYRIAVDLRKMKEGDPKFLGPLTGRHVRVRDNQTLIRVKDRWVKNDSLHHVEVVEIDGKWTLRSVNRIEARERLNRGEKLYDGYLCLHNGDRIEYGKNQVGIVRTCCATEITAVHPNDAREMKEIKTDKGMLRITTGIGMIKMGVRKGDGVLVK